ncbi:unnamed protein product [Paramecium sonneborni]|uniref:Uncharacterized protein n=1 Tax=Paramecium sonneborni TaxID=65129 RepID=A0A8S1LYS4_9CILI|nr:unnamed protein product [Paramecium sonneborni]
MTKAEKAAIIFGLGSTALLAIYSIVKPRMSQGNNTESLIQRRNAILNKDNMRVLYSTMTFFYLQGYKKTGEDLALLKEVLDVAKPKLVALQISEKQLEEEYRPILRNPHLQEIMKKVDYHLKTNPEEVTKMKELDFYAGLENIYAMHYCQQNSCKIISADEHPSYYDQLYSQKIGLKEVTKSGKLEIPENLKQLYQSYDMSDLEKTEQDIKEDIYVKKRADIFVDKIVHELTPTFNIIPDVPYKVLVGIVDPKLQNIIAKEWKQRFLSIYGHQILEDEQHNQQQSQIQ